MINKNIIGDLQYGIVRFEFIRLGFETFSTEPVTVDESTMGDLCVFEEDLYMIQLISITQQRDPA